MNTRPRRIILWGGSFNPPTRAHKALADFVFHAVSADIMQWIVCPHNVEKDPATLAPFDDRYNMVAQILADEPAMHADDTEHRQGSSLSIDTVRHFRGIYPHDYLFFMLGADNWLGLPDWDGFTGPQGPAELFDYVSIIAMDRPGYSVLRDASATTLYADRQVMAAADLKSHDSFFIVPNPLYDMAATQVRHDLRQGRVPTQINAVTYRYILEHRLYSAGQHDKNPS